MDGVFCISLEEREDRRTLLRKEFADTRLNIEFYIAKKDTNPERGCFSSHQACAALALERGYKNVLILEDDATLVGVKNSAIRRINHFLSSRQPDLFYLGVTLGTMWLTWSFNITRCRAKGTHAYILSNSACKKLLAFEYSDLPIDRLYSKSFKAYCAFPMICQQQPEEINPSDISSGATHSFWANNWRRQYREIFRNIGKTLIRRDF
ncbi:glycosyltransferase family 25 protein [Pseudomonas sp. 1152_12]|uniref:glycosyltransferase family 25 protein n=1 Tax=Pseudomonas sp. 1152_12 TaxID=2604455 RepID=UPI004062C3D3